MRDETDFARWGLIGLVVMTVGLAAMKHWYRDRPRHGHSSSHAEASTPRRRPKPVASPTPVPAAPAAPAEPRIQDVVMPVVQLPPGRSLWFAKYVDDRALDWSTTDRVFIWLWEDARQEKVKLPIPSQRDNFSPFLLDDGRLALIGGRTPSDVVALERKCEDCPDEYVNFGEPAPSATSDIYDFESGRWSQGPTADFAGNAGDSTIRLKDGRYFRVSVDQTALPDGMYAENVVVEIADRDFKQWKHAGQFHYQGLSAFAEVKAFESGDGVDLRPPYAGAAYLQWTAPDTLVLTPAEVSR